MKKRLIYVLIITMLIISVLLLPISTIIWILTGVNPIFYFREKQTDNDLYF